MKRNRIILALLLWISPSTAGDLKGQITKEADGIVVAIQGVKGDFSPPDSHSFLDQRNMLFIPPLLPVLRGTTVDFPNNELVIYHNVFSISPAEKFNLGTYRSGEFRSVTFDQAGLVEIFCLIHTRMYAVIPVFDSPFFTVADENGMFEIKDIPAGNYVVSTILVYLVKQEYEEIRHNIIIPVQGVVTITLP